MTVNFDVKTSHKAMGHPLRKKPLCAKYYIQIRLQLRYIAKGVTRLFVKIFNLFLETQVRLLIFCMFKAEIQIEPLAINELHLESSKYRFFLSRALNIPLEKVSQIRKKTCVFSVKRYDNLQFLRLENEAIGGKCFLQTILQFIL